MTTEFQTDVSLNESNIVNIDIGEKLKAARLERNLDERQVATELKIPIDQVRALEDNRFNYFRSATFARGYLKAYCRLLDLNLQEMLGAFDALSSASEKESNIKPVDKVDNKQIGFGDPFVILITVVILGVLVFLAFWWPTFSSNNSAVIQKNPPTEQTAPADESEPKQTTLAPTDTASSEDASKSSDDASKTTAVDSNTPTSSDSSASAKPTEEDGVTTGMSAETMALLEKSGVNLQKVEEATKEAATANETEEDDHLTQAPIYTDDIEIEFNADCWTEIRDSTDKILFSGVKKAGSKLGVTGTGPYRVVLGYSRGVSSFKFKGESFDFTQYIHKDLARFELK